LKVSLDAKHPSSKSSQTLSSQSQSRIFFDLASTGVILVSRHVLGQYPSSGDPLRPSQTHSQGMDKPKAIEDAWFSRPYQPLLILSLLDPGC
jgi:hypothetical protein